MKKEFISSTIGMLANHPELSKSVLTRVQYYRTKDGIEMHPVSGHNLARIKKVPTFVITTQQYNARDCDDCDETVEFFWALRQLGFDTDDE